jgi:hypothetical protein
MPGESRVLFFPLYLNVDANQKGCLAEYRFALEVSMPLLPSSSYDCIVETNGVLYKIQVKSTNSRSKDNKGVHIKIRRQEGDYPLKLVDYFAIWVNEFQGFFIFKNDGKLKVKRLNLSGANKIYFNNFAFA